MGLAHNSAPTAWPCWAVTTLNTPAGNPAAAAKCASARAERGVSSAGLITTAQPAAKAGATLRAIIELGKFQGVMAPTTPTGSLSAYSKWLLRLEGSTSPLMRMASCADQRMWLIDERTSPCDWAK